MENRPEQVLAVSPDATSLKVAEQRIRILLEVNNAIINKLNQDELLRAVCKALQGVLPFQSFCDHSLRSGTGYASDRRAER